jgi:hypothetical protein
MTTVKRPPLRIPSLIRRSTLMRQGGFATYDGLLNDGLFLRLLREAQSRYEMAVETHAAMPDREDWRGGSPARRFLNVVGGDVQTAFYQDGGVCNLLARLCGVSLRPSGACGAFTYYARPGDHLAVHRDIQRCDLAVITCLQETHAEERAGKLVVYPNRLNEPLSALRATPDDGFIPQALGPGQTILLFGGIVPHQVLPVAEHQVRIVSILCYEATRNGH